MTTASLPGDSRGQLLNYFFQEIDSMKLLKAALFTVLLVFPIARTIAQQQDSLWETKFRSLIDKNVIREKIEVPLL